MDIVGEERGRLERLALWLDATRAELTGLAVLLAGAVVATGALWWSALGPTEPAPTPSGIAAEVDAEAFAQRGEGPPGSGAGGWEAEPGSGDAGSAGPTTARSAPHAVEAGAPLTVHVTGAVATPGVITVEAGARVADAITAAGEATAEGEPHRLNLARPLTDGEQVHVPTEGEEVATDAGSAPGGGAGVDAGGRVDLNRADAATLETLPGIGPARAAAIVEYREEHGPFAEPGDLRGVSGIGEATFQRLAEDVTVS